MTFLSGSKKFGLFLPDSLSGNFCHPRDVVGDGFDRLLLVLRVVVGQTSKKPEVAKDPQVVLLNSHTSGP